MRMTVCAHDLSPVELSIHASPCFTSVLAMTFCGGCCFVFVLWFVGLAVRLRLLGLYFACAPYPPSYISYEDSSHSEMGT